MASITMLMIIQDKLGLQEVTHAFPTARFSTAKPIPTDNMAKMAKMFSMQNKAGTPSFQNFSAIEAAKPSV